MSQAPFDLAKMLGDGPFTYVPNRAAHTRPILYWLRRYYQPMADKLGMEVVVRDNATNPDGNHCIVAGVYEHMGRLYIFSSTPLKIKVDTPKLLNKWYLLIRADEPLNMDKPIKEYIKENFIPWNVNFLDPGNLIGGGSIEFIGGDPKVTGAR